MDKEEARMIIRRIAMFGDIIISKGHPTKRKIERKFTTQDAQRVIIGGKMVEDPVDHDEGFECAMEGQLDDGRILRIPIIVNDDEDYIIVKSFVRK
jgi:hypothetical protein